MYGRLLRNRRRSAGRENSGKPSRRCGKGARTRRLDEFAT
jgi:hypothetical protein